VAAARDPFRVVGRTIAGKYEIERLVGEGGYGVVYAGTHLLLRAPIAIKLFKPLPAAGADGRAAELFLREARVLFELTHPSIVRMYDLGTVDTPFDAVPYVVLELVEGRSLEEEIALRRAVRSPFSLAELRAIFEPVLDALATAHERGIAHRDLKPSNIMLAGRGSAITPKVVDFGVARWVDEHGPPSDRRTGFTPAYAAPEQWSEGLGAAGPPTDVFAIGLVLAEACTLEAALAAKSPALLFAAAMKEGRKVDLKQARPDAPGALQVVLDTALHVQPSARYPNARAMLAAVRAALAGDGIALDATSPDPAALRKTVSSSPPLRVRPAPRARRARWAALGIAAGAIACVAALLARRAFARRGDVRVEHHLAGAEYTSAQIDAVTSAHLDEIRDCYKEGLTRAPSLAGEVAILAGVKRSGEVHKAFDADRGMATTRELADDAVRACVASRIESWSFPPHKKDDVEGVLYVFTFHPAAAPPPDDARDALVFAGHYVSEWGNKSTGVAYAPEDATVRAWGARATIDYPDGVMACWAFRDRTLLCRWMQVDTVGRGQLALRAGGVLDGTWGFDPSDSNGGSWTMKPR
jgi:hypothetical protein